METGSGFYDKLREDCINFVKRWYILKDEFFSIDVL